MPVEIISHIVAHLDLSDRLKLRATNRELCLITTPLTFKRLYTAFTPGALQGLARIASSSLARHVQHLTISIETLPNVNKDMWQYPVKLGKLRQAGEPLPPGDEVFRRSHDPVTAYYSQKELTIARTKFRDIAHLALPGGDGSVADVVNEIFSGLRNLRKVDLIGALHSLWEQHPNELEACSPWRNTLTESTWLRSYCCRNDRRPRDVPLWSPHESSLSHWPRT